MLLEQPHIGEGLVLRSEVHCNVIRVRPEAICLGAGPFSFNTSISTTTSCHIHSIRQYRRSIFLYPRYRNMGSDLSLVVSQEIICLHKLHKFPEPHIQRMLRKSMFSQIDTDFLCIYRVAYRQHSQ